MNLIFGIIKESWSLFYQMSSYLVLGFLVASFIHIFLKQQTILNHLGKPGILSILKSVLFGIPLPLCSCGVLPPATTLYRSGASRGSVIAFLIATPTTGIDSILATYGLLGGIFMFFRLITTFVIGLFAGLIVDIFSKEKKTGEKTISNSSLYCSDSTIIGGLRYAFFELYGSIAKWIFWGVLIGGIISYLVPERIVSQYLGKGYLSYLLMVLIGVPLYVCATGSIPVAVSLIAKGMSPGAGLVFLIAGPATNAVTMLFVVKTIGKKSFVIYIFSIIAGAILAGLMFDGIFRNYSITIKEIFHQHPSFSPVSFLSSLILVLLGINFMIEALRKKLKKKKAKNCFVFSVPDISCANCAKKISEKIYSVDGIKSVDIDVKRKIVKVCSELDNAEKIKQILFSIGYPVSE